MTPNYVNTTEICTHYTGFGYATDFTILFIDLAQQWCFLVQRSSPRGYGTVFFVSTILASNELCKADPSITALSLSLFQQVFEKWTTSLL
jgi:hypothetical protein